MKKTLLFLALALALQVQAKLPEREANRYADAILKAEGVPTYGIQVPTRNPRSVCIRTVQNTHDRWLACGQPGAFVDFLARRYCPPAADPVGHRNWKKNVRFFLSQ